jgi:hypothetical protein
MDGFEVEHPSLREAGRAIGQSATGAQQVQSALQAGVQAGKAGIMSYAIAAALDGYLREAQAALRSVGTALEDHGGGLVNAASNYDNVDREMSWMFKRITAKYQR